MKNSSILVTALLVQTALVSLAQNNSAAKQYAHKVKIDSIIQTKSYTYLKVSEKLTGKDTSIWMALPSIEPVVGGTYYYESGLQMGRFQSKELNRTFDHILFLASLSTCISYDPKCLIPLPVTDSVKVSSVPVILHSVFVKEVIQTSGYTYLRVIEGTKEEWLAVVKIQASPGQTYTYTDAAPMSGFYSKELNRSFAEVLFLSRLTRVNDSKEEDAAWQATHVQSHKDKQGKAKGKAKQGALIQPEKGGISIGDLLKNKKDYAGKIVKVRGEVTKFSAGILDKNWIHIEDGTFFGSTFDLTITTDEVVKPGDVVTFEGVVHLDKDFGSGYTFEVIMENGVVRQKSL
jgi:hypothetical protein